MLQSGSRPGQPHSVPRPVQQQPQQQGPSQTLFPQHPQYPPQFYPTPQGQWGRGGPPGPGYPGMPPYGAPAGWIPPPVQGFPQPGPFPYNPYRQYPSGPPNQQQQPSKPSPIGSGGNKQQNVAGVHPADRVAEPTILSKPIDTSTPELSSNAPIAPIESKPVAKPSQVPEGQPSASQGATAKVVPGVSRNGRIIPALPLQSPSVPKGTIQGNAGNPAKLANAAPNRAAIDDATQAATAAVAAAMAKLAPVAVQQNGDNAMDNLTKKVNELRTNDPIRAPRHPGAEGFGNRGGRDGHRGRVRGGSRQETRKVEVPKADFDFESSNAKFNKDELLKEANTGSPLAEKGDSIENGDVSNAPTTSYNKASSFFDDLSSEIKDRAEATTQRPGGREWRGEEQKKNLETFGQGSVDNGYRGGYRGRGRGRGRGRSYGGNGQPGRGRGGFRGGRGESQTFAA